MIKLINYIFFLVRKNTIKIEKRFDLSLKMFSLSRTRYRKLELKKTKHINELSNKIRLGNYYGIDPQKKINMISGGIGTNIDFEIDCLKKLNISKLIMVDPTDEGENTSKEITNKDGSFIKKPIFNESKKIKIYLAPDKNNPNISIDNSYASSEYLTLNSITIDEIMKNNEMEKLDFLKLDIEGVADIVIKDLIEKNIFPDQIAFELEKNNSVFIQRSYYNRIEIFLDFLNKYYDIYSSTALKYGFRMDLLAIKKNK